MDELRAYTEAVYEIPTCDAIRSWYEFDETCQGTMPAAFAAFFDSTGFEDAIRNAISRRRCHAHKTAAASMARKADVQSSSLPEPSQELTDRSNTVCR